MDVFCHLFVPQMSKNHVCTKEKQVLSRIYMRSQSYDLYHYFMYVQSILVSFPLYFFAHFLGTVLLIDF